MKRASASALAGLAGLSLVFAGCAREADPKTYEIPRETAATFRIVDCPSPRPAPATAVVCPVANK